MFYSVVVSILFNPDNFDLVYGLRYQFGSHFSLHARIVWWFGRRACCNSPSDQQQHDDTQCTWSVKRKKSQCSHAEKW